MKAFPALNYVGLFLNSKKCVCILYRFIKCEYSIFAVLGIILSFEVCVTREM